MTTDPFASLDIDGVGELRKSVLPRDARRNQTSRLAFAESMQPVPKPIRYPSDLELSYLSCSPYRLPNAGLASAQAAIIKKRNEGRPS